MKSKDSLNSVFELKTEMNLQFRRVMASIVLILVSLCSINVLLTIVVTSEKVCLGHRKIPYTQLSWTTFSKCKLPPAERTIYQYSSDSPIHLDAVITYVNGADPKFENMKKKYQSKGKLVRYSNTPNRFADNFDLKFLLRSLDKYGQLFRFVFLVVAFESQIPKWLNLKHAKLKIVMHSDIWYNLTHLPTFNSLAIEANLHHIQNVSNIFVYFNDDLLLTQPAELSDFVSVSEGFRVDSIVVRPYMSLEKYDKPVSLKDSEAHWLNSGIIARNTAESACDYKNVYEAYGFNQFIQHSPHVLIKDVLLKAENISEVQKIMQKTWQSKFRGGAELNIVAFLTLFAQCHSKINVTKGNASELFYLSRRNVPLTKKYEVETVRAIRKLNFGIDTGLVKYVCINDNSISINRLRKHNITSSSLIDNWRVKMFPTKSSFEL